MSSLFDSTAAQVLPIRKGDTVRAKLTGAPLVSLWGDLSPYLLGTFSPMKRAGSALDVDGDASPVIAAITEANLEVALNWQSPFENSGPEQRAPMLMAMLQAGAIQPVADTLATMMGGDSSIAGRAAAELSSGLDRFVGRTGITKLNSTQVFNGMPPIKIQLQALFRAWRDPVAEVEKPFAQLMSWALPAKLAKDSTFLSRAAQWAAPGSNIDLVDVLMPSHAPTLISFKYKKRSFPPMVIEAISMPLGSPIDKNSNFVELLVPMTLCTLTALDKDDWKDVGPI